MDAARIAPARISRWQPAHGVASLFSLTHKTLVSQGKNRGSFRCAVSNSSGGPPSQRAQFSSQYTYGQGGYGQGGGGGPVGTQPQSQSFLRPKPQEGVQGELSPQEMLDVLSERRGNWFDYAPYISALLRQGFNPSMLAEITGIEGSEQNIMVVAAQVHSTLKELGCQSLPFFDLGGADILYELRILSTNRRKDAADFVASVNMDGKGARELAKAMKEHERRKREEGWEAFSIAPGDCMAFAYYRQSKEERSDDEKANCLERALEYSETEAAAERLKQALLRIAEPEHSAFAVEVTAPKVPTVRLRMDETYPKPIPILGLLHELSPGSFQEAALSAGVTRSEGPFEVFCPSRASSWMAVPSWPAILGSSGSLAGVLVEDANMIPSLRGKDMKEPLVLVLETQFSGSDLSSNGLFLCAEGDKIVVSATATQRLARVVTAILPPKVGAEGESLDD